jgi:hypothetical protein
MAPIEYFSNFVMAIFSTRRPTRLIALGTRLAAING